MSRSNNEVRGWFGGQLATDCCDALGRHARTTKLRAPDFDRHAHALQVVRPKQECVRWVSENASFDSSIPSLNLRRDLELSEGFARAFDLAS